MQHPNRVLRLAVFMVFNSCIAISAYLPAMPAMIQGLHTSQKQIKLVYALLIISYGISMLFYGPISDRMGRRTPLLVGLGLYLLGSLIACLAPHISWLLLARVLQGVGIGAAIIAYAMTKDIFHGAQFVRASAVLSGGISAGNIFSLVLGGYLLYFWGWRAGFVFMFIYGCFLFSLIYFSLPETHPLAKRIADKTSILKMYKPFLTSASYLAWVFIATFVMAIEFIYGSSSAFILQTQLHISSVVYGWLTIPLTTSGIIGASIAAFLSHRISVHKLVCLGLSLVTLGGLLLLFAAHFNTVLALLLPMAIVFIGTVITCVSISSASLSLMPKHTGVAAALQWCIILTVSGLLTALCAKLGIHNQAGVAWAILCLVVIAWSLAFLYPCRIQHE